MTKQITTTLYAFWRKSDYTGDDEYGVIPFDFRLWNESSRDGRVFIKEIEFTFDVPADFNPVPEQLAVLEAAKQKARAEFHARVTEIDRQIQSLLAIEHEVPA